MESTGTLLPPLCLGSPALPVVTFVLDARFSLAGIHACLCAIHAAGIDDEADIVLVDDGTLPDAALLPKLVQNLHYLRLQPDQSTLDARNILARLPNRSWIACLAEAVRPTRAWWEAAMAIFTRQADCAVLGTKLVRSAGVIEASGLLPDANGRLVDFARAEHEAQPAANMLRPVVAVSDAAMIVRVDVITALDGFDSSFTDPADATTEFCIRCWEEGYSILYQPVASLHCDGDIWNAGDRSADPADAEWLAHRWSAGAHPTWPAQGG